MELHISKMEAMVIEAFDAGYDNVDKEDFIQALFQRHQIDEKDDAAPVQQDFRIYKIEELRKFPPLTRFVHQKLGGCEIRERHGEKYMVFDVGGLAPSGFKVDGYPWDVEMQKVMAQ